MSMNPAMANRGMNYYNRGYGRQMPYHNQNQARIPMHGAHNFQRQGGYPRALGGRSPMANNNFRLPQIINSNAGHHQMNMPLMNGMHGMNGMQTAHGMHGMNHMQSHGMPGMHGMNHMQPGSGMSGAAGMSPIQSMPAATSAGMNTAAGAQQSQSMGPVTFEPYNPAQHPASQPFMPARAGSAPSSMPSMPPAAPLAAGSNSYGAILSNFIQGEKNAAYFYTELSGFAKDEYSRTVLNQIADNASGRKLLLDSLYTKITGTQNPARDVPVIKSPNFRQGIRAAVTIENNTVKEMSALYDQIENGMQLKSLNSVIQKKLVDINALQQIAIATVV